MFPSILTFDFDLILWSFLTFWGPNGLLFGVAVGFIKCFGVYLCSWTTFMFYVSFKSDLLFWLNFGVNFYFSGPYWAISVWFQNCFGVSSCSWTTFIFYVSFYSDIWFWLNLGSFLTFWCPNRLFLGLG